MIRLFILMTFVLSVFCENALAEARFKDFDNYFKLCGEFTEREFLYLDGSTNENKTYKGQLGRMKVEVWVYPPTKRISGLFTSVEGENLYSEFRAVLQKTYGAPNKDESKYHGRFTNFDGGWRTAYSDNNIYWNNLGSGVESIQLLAYDSFSDHDKYDRFLERTPSTTRFSAYCSEAVYKSELKSAAKKNKRTNRNKK